MVLAWVWEVAALVAQIAQLSVLPAVPTPLLWQSAGADHACSSARVPGSEVLVWARTEPEPYVGRVLWAGARPPAWSAWSVGWTGGEGQRLWWKGGRAASVVAARWNAEVVVQALLADPHRAISPQNGEPLIT